MFKLRLPAKGREQGEGEKFDLVASPYYVGGMIRGQ